MRLRIAAFFAACTATLFSAAAHAGLVVADLGKTYTPNPAVVPIMQTQYDTGGTTSVRNIDQANLEWKTEGYYQRNRDLGQVFTPQTTFILDAIVLRTGPTTGAVRDGAPGAGVFIQFFEVVGTPVINDNGTPPGTNATHGFTTNHRADDFIEGVAYQSIAVIGGGTFPNMPVTTSGSTAGMLRYMRWDLTGANELVFQAGKQYAFMVGFEQPGADRSFSLANKNEAANPAPPTLNVLYPGGWAIRREGDGTLPPTQVPGATPPSDPTMRQTLIDESLFATGAARYALSPTTDGYPDVDTYRDLEFYMEIVPPPPPLSLFAAKDAFVDGRSGNQNSVQETGRLAIRTDQSRKAWFGFDLSSVPAFHEVTAAQLVLTAQADLTNIVSGSKLEVYALTDDALDSWNEATLTFSNAPGNAVGPYQLDPNKTMLLGSIPVPYISAAGQQIGIGLNPGFFNTVDGNDYATLIVVMRDEATPTAGRSSAWIYSRESVGGTAARLDLTLIPVPEPSAAVLVLMLGSVVGIAGLSARKRRLPTESD